MCGVSKRAWYHVPRPRNVTPDPEVRDAILGIAPQRPTYGTRRMAAQASRELNRPVNCKAVRRVFKRPGLERACTHEEGDHPVQQEDPGAQRTEPVLGV